MKDFIDHSTNLLIKAVFSSSQIQKLKESINEWTSIMNYFATTHDIINSSPEIEMIRIESEIKAIHKKLPKIKKPQNDLSNELMICHPESYYFAILKWAWDNMDLENVLTVWSDVILIVKMHTM